MTEMTDSFQHSKLEGGDFNSDLITCGHSDNRFSDTCSKSENAIQETSNHDSKRIDYILYKLIIRSGCHHTLE